MERASECLRWFADMFATLTRHTPRSTPRCWEKWRPHHPPGERIPCGIRKRDPPKMVNGYWNMIEILKLHKLLLKYDWTYYWNTIEILERYLKHTRHVLWLLRLYFKDTWLTSRKSLPSCSQIKASVGFPKCDEIWVHDHHDCPLGCTHGSADTAIQWSWFKMEQLLKATKHEETMKLLWITMKCLGGNFQAIPSTQATQGSCCHPREYPTEPLRRLHAPHEHPLQPVQLIQQN